MLDKKDATPMIVHFLMMLQLPRLTIDLGLVYVAAILAAAEGAPVIPWNLKKAIQGIRAHYDVLNERWLATIVAKENEAKLSKVYERAKKVIRLLYRHLDNLAELDEGSDGVRAKELSKELLPNGLEILRLAAPELFGKLRGLGFVTERQYMDELIALDAGRLAKALTEAIEEYGELYGMKGPPPRNDEPTMGSLYFKMMDSVRIYVFQIMAWVTLEPEHMETADMLLSPAQRWIELNRERNKAKASKREKMVETNPKAKSENAKDSANAQLSPTTSTIPASTEGIALEASGG